MYKLWERQSQRPFCHELHEFLSPVFVLIRGRLATSPKCYMRPIVNLINAHQQLGDLVGSIIGQDLIRHGSAASQGLEQRTVLLDEMARKECSALCEPPA